MGSAEAREDGAQHFLGGGLAGTAGHRNHPAAEAGAREAAQPGQRAQRVVHQQHVRHARHGTVDHCAGGTFGDGVGDKIVAIAPFSGQGDEQIARLQGAGIDGHAGRAERGSERAAGCLRQIDRGPEDFGHTRPPARSPHKARTTLASSNGMTEEPMICPCSWPLPAMASTSPGRRSVIAPKPLRPR